MSFPCKKAKIMTLVLKQALEVALSKCTSCKTTGRPLNSKKISFDKLLRTFNDHVRPYLFRIGTWISSLKALSRCGFAVQRPRGRKDDLRKGWQSGEVDSNTSVVLVLGPVVRLSASGDVSLDGLPRVGRACQGQRGGHKVVRLSELVNRMVDSTADSGRKQRREHRGRSHETGTRTWFSQIGSVPHVRWSLATTVRVGSRVDFEQEVVGAKRAWSFTEVRVDSDI